MECVHSPSLTRLSRFLFNLFSFDFLSSGDLQDYHMCRLRCVGLSILFLRRVEIIELSATHPVAVIIKAISAELKPEYTVSLNSLE